MVPLALTLVGWKPFWGHTIKPCHSIDDDNHECCAVNCTGTVNKYKFKKYMYIHVLSIKSYVHVSCIITLLFMCTITYIT